MISFKTWKSQIKPMKGLEIYVSGVVQGVGFRYFSKRSAKDLGIKGYAKNLEDGRVFVKAEGESEQLDKFVSLLKEGPSYAIVKGIDVTEVDKIDNFEDFSIEY